jgi:hypothetical protein
VRTRGKNDADEKQQREKDAVVAAAAAPARSLPFSSVFVLRLLLSRGRRSENHVDDVFLVLSARL